MGVPQFFHWLVTHYQTQLLTDAYPYKKKPEYLYLDFNCGIHPAVKQDGIETLEDMYQKVCEYLETIISQVKPSKMVYIAIDGVAPLAKMKQQRVRRFKAVQDKRELDRIARRHNKFKKSKFDFNMISPGTQFMEELSIELNRFIEVTLKKKYPQLKFVLDDASCYGEGEHKVMHHIRTQIPKDASVIVYGLDSDLIFLCLRHYKPNFCLFREKIFFDGKPGDKDLDGPLFTYLDVGNFRKILLSMMNPALTKNALNSWGILKPSKERLHDELNIASLDFDTIDLNNSKEIEENEMNIRKNENAEQRNKRVDLNMFQAKLELTDQQEDQLILDYVAICFVLGNDFLPHIPSLKIKEGGLNRIIECYKEVQEDLPGSYLVDDDARNYNHRFLCRLLEKVSNYEDIDLTKQTEASDLRKSRFKNGYRLRTAEPYDRDVMNYEYIEDKYHDILRMGDHDWKQRYYSHYLGGDNRSSNGTNSRKTDMIKNYLNGLVWTLRYYVGNGSIEKMEDTCPDWEYSYHFRVAPAASCLLEFLKTCSKIREEFSEAKPARTVEQLLMIFPPQSCSLLLPKFAKLMTMVDSPIIYQYPTNFEIDMIGHRFRWECYPILPPVNLQLVKKVVSTIIDQKNIDIDDIVDIDNIDDI